MASDARKRPRTAITVDAELLRWVESRCEPGGLFASPSHFFERAGFLLKEETEEVERFLQERRSARRKDRERP